MEKKKYSARNWEKGMTLSQYIDSAERHLAKLKCGMRDEPHATQVIWNMIGYVFTAWLITIGNRPAELNDMPDQISWETVTSATPLSPYEVTSLNTFFGTNYNPDGSKQEEKTEPKTTTSEHTVPKNTSERTLPKYWPDNA